MPWGAPSPASQPGEGGDCPALPRAGAASPRVLWAALGAAGHWGYKGTGECPEEGMELGKGLEGKRHEERLKSLGLFSWSRGGRGQPHGPAAPSRGQEEGQGWSLLSGDQRQDQ